MNTRLYIGSLPYETSEEELRAFFETGTEGGPEGLGEGSVQDVQLIRDHNTQRPKGFGFITMSTAENAKVAIESFNNQQYKGRTLTVAKAEDKNRGERNRPFGGSGARRGGESRNRNGGGYRNNNGGNYHSSNDRNKDSSW